MRFSTEGLYLAYALIDTIIIITNIGSSELNVFVFSDNKNNCYAICKIMCTGRAVALAGWIGSHDERLEYFCTQKLQKKKL